MNVLRTETPGSGLSLHRAQHVGSDYEIDIADCRAAISTHEGLAFVAHLTAGTFDFAVSRPGVWPNREGLASVFERAGQQLGLAMNELGTACEQVDGSALIRMVLHGERGALFKVVKVAGQTLFGAIFDGALDAVDQADLQLVELADSAARRIGMASMQWGGFQVRENSGDLCRPYTALQTRGVLTPRIAFTEPAVLPAPAAKACFSLLNDGDLHYLAIYRRGQLIWQADIFDDQTLLPFPKRVTPEARRRGYDRLARQVGLQTRRFRQALALVRSERLTRLVLDVARGTIVTLSFNDAVSVVGATVVGGTPGRADRKLWALRDPLLAALQHRAIVAE